MVKILKTHLIGKESFLQIEKYFINMHKDRNRVSHINEELTAKEIFESIRGEHVAVIEKFKSS